MFTENEDFIIPRSTLVFLRGGQRCYRIEIIDDNITEPIERFRVLLVPNEFTLSNVVIENSVAIVEIIDNGKPNMKRKRPHAIMLLLQYY